MTEECEECGKEFDSERGLHIHEAQVHKENEVERNDSTENENEHEPSTLSLNIKQVGYASFIVGLLTGLLLGTLMFGVGGNSASPGAPSAETGNTGNTGSGTADVVELESGEYPYGDLEAGVGSDNRTFGDVTFRLEGEPYIGSPDAEVTAVSYEDFECPFCSRYNQDAYPQIVDNYVRNGDVQYFFKNLPLQNIHPWAESSAIASECALNQDPEAFWTFKQGFFNNQDELGNAHQNGNFDQSMYRWAEQTGLDTEEFRTCYDNEEEIEEVNQDKQQAGENGASATPSIIVNSELVEGAQPYSRFESVIESALQ